MDVVGSVKSLCTLSVSVLKWIDETTEKKETLVNLSSTVKRIHEILERFQDVPSIEPVLLNSFLGLGDMLSRTKEHLAMYGSKRKKPSLSKTISFLVPAQATKRLVQDEQQLANQLVLILFAMSSDTFLKNHHQPTLSLKEQIQLPRPAAKNENGDLTQFWVDYVGRKISFATTERFSESLSLCFGRWLDQETRCQLILYLDEYNVGGVSRCSLEHFSGKRPLKEAIDMFVDASKRVPAESSMIESLYVEMPLIVWIDDDLENIGDGIAWAEMENVKVHYLTSTGLGKAWIEENEELLRAADRAQKIRFISDNVRFEAESPTADSFLNIAAGENILRFLRGRNFKAPVLIYCGGSIKDTTYVSLYTATGSTCCIDVVQHYISALAEGRANDEEWKGFDRMLEYVS